MGGRYLVSGVQLGLIITLIKQEPDDAIKKIHHILDNQYIGDSEESIGVDVSQMTIRGQK